MIVDANGLVVRIDNEIRAPPPSPPPPARLTAARGAVAIHKYMREVYGKRFPELEQLVLHPLDYARTVKGGRGAALHGTALRWAHRHRPQ